MAYFLQGEQRHISFNTIHTHTHTYSLHQLLHLSSVVGKIPLSINDVDRSTASGLTF
jgi:hypothetical protein